MVRTYLALDGAGALVGYVALMSDAIVLQTGEKKKLHLSSQDHPVVPALKVARVAVATAMQRSGAGHVLMRFAAATGFAVAEKVGCRLLTLDAYPDAVPFYEKLGFIRNRSKEYRERNHPSMRLDLFAPDAHAVDDAGVVDAGVAPACSPCRAMNEDECRADLRCEAVPRWGNSIMPCPVDERGFSCIWVGCRQAGMNEICPDLEAVMACAECSVESLPIDERGCRTCAPCESGFVDDVATCAVESLCAEVPTAAECSR